MIQTNHLEYNHFTELWMEHVDGVAGNAQSIGNPAGADNQLVHIETLFTTDANAANRIVTLKILQDTLIITLGVSNTNQVASKARLYVFGIGLAIYDDPGVEYLFFPLHDRLRIRSTAIITFDAINIQVGDQFTDTRTIQNIWQSV